MSTTLPFASTETHPNYLNVDYGWKSWLFTTDHKRIALLYLFSITAFFFVGGAFAVGMRLNLLTPEGSSWCSFSWFHRSLQRSVTF
jgi:cytochrome c oxidase subunit I